jgi:ABC-2 type transport system permease protein
MKEFKVWLKYTSNSFQQVLTNRSLMAVFLIGKSLRILLFLMFLGFLFQGATNLAGYNRDQIIFFYLSFNLIDTLGQLFYREVYRFRSLLISGGLDSILLKPISPLIRVLAGGADVMDLIMLVFLTLAVLWFGLTRISLHPFSWLVYVVLIISGLFISTALHTFVLGLSILTLSVDHLIMIYRDITSMLRIPVDLYIEPIRFILTFLIPVGIMITFPPKALMGLISLPLTVFSVVFSLFLFFISVFFWRYSLRYYQSASS